MHENLIRLRDEALAELASAADADALEIWRVRYLSRKGGALTTAMGVLGTLPHEERPAYGQAANEVKNALEAAFTERQDVLKAAALEAELASGTVDITLPGRPPSVGHLHVTTQNLRQLYAVFGGMGFEVYDGPDVETDDYNFGLLNIPAYHPARDMWDTFWVSQDVGAGLRTRSGTDENQAQKPAPTLVMRTHTSPGQIRVIRERCPEPIRVVLPGKCYRYEQITARSEHQFYQMEGMAVGKGIRMTDLIGTLKEFARQMYGSQPAPVAGARAATSPSPSRVSRPTWTASCAAVKAAACANTPGGSNRGRWDGAPGRPAQRRLRPGHLFRLRFRHGRRAAHDVEEPDKRYSVFLWE